MRYYEILWDNEMHKQYLVILYQAKGSMLIDVQWFAVVQQGHCIRIVDMLEYNVKGGKMNRGRMVTWKFLAADSGFVFVAHVATL